MTTISVRICYIRLYFHDQHPPTGQPLPFAATPGIVGITNGFGAMLDSCRASNKQTNFGNIRTLLTQKNPVLLIMSLRVEVSEIRGTFS